MSHTLINCTCKNRLGFSLLPFTLIPQYLKRFNWSIQWNPLTFSLFSFASMISKCTSRAWSVDVRSQSLSSESAVKYPHVSSTSDEERFKYSLPQGQQRQSNSNPMHCLLPPPRQLYIDRCITNKNTNRSRPVVVEWRVVQDTCLGPLGSAWVSLTIVFFCVGIAFHALASNVETVFLYVYRHYSM